jgi:hypothetical protein
MQMLFQTLFLPDIIHLQITGKDNQPFLQEKILIGIKTIATYRNNIDISPFLTDKDGHITITKQEIQNREKIFISYGIMDYVGVEYAKPDIQIYFWGNDALDRYINYWTSLLKSKNIQELEKWVSFTKEDLEKFDEIDKRETKDLTIFETCFNRKINQRQDIVLIEDTWDKPVMEKNYRAILAL